jgi:hypothetical protein
MKNKTSLSLILITLSALFLISKLEAQELHQDTLELACQTLRTALNKQLEQEKKTRRTHKKLVISHVRDMLRLISLSDHQALLQDSDNSILNMPLEEKLRNFSYDHSIPKDSSRMCFNIISSDPFEYDLKTHRCVNQNKRGESIVPIYQRRRYDSKEISVMKMPHGFKVAFFYHHDRFENFVFDITGDTSVTELQIQEYLKNELSEEDKMIVIEQKLPEQCRNFKEVYNCR